MGDKDVHDFDRGLRTIVWILVWFASWNESCASDVVKETFLFLASHHKTSFVNCVVLPEASGMTRDGMRLRRRSREYLESRWS
jgi:hypothetical protein